MNVSEIIHFSARHLRMSKTPKNENLPDYSSHKEHAWNYFAMNAEQRMKAFHFNIIISGVSIAALSNQVSDSNWLTSIAISVFIMFMAGVFFVLDLRSRQLLKYGIEALKDMEEKDTSTPESVAVFALEEAHRAKHPVQATLVSYTTAITVFCALVFVLGLWSLDYCWEASFSDVLSDSLTLEKGQ